MTSRDINTINMVIINAEAEIKKRTGQHLKLIVAPVVEKNDHRGYNVLGLMHVVANALDMQPADYSELLRERPYVYLRMIAAHFIRVYYPGVSLKEIAKHMGGKDHTTVIYYLKTVDQLLEKKDDEFCYKYNVALNVVTQWLAEE